MVKNVFNAIRTHAYFALYYDPANDDLKSNES